MKIKYLPFPGKAVWQNNKPFISFLLSLLLIHSILKIIFYNYNFHLFFTGTEESNSLNDKIKLVKWSLADDLLIILLINTALLFLLHLGRPVSFKITTWFILPIFFLVNSFAVLLNLADIFYFPFHFQRANADLLYVLEHPLKLLFHYNILIIAFFSASIAVIFFLIWKLHRNLLTAFAKGNHAVLITSVLLLCITLLLFFQNRLIKFLVPTYPLVELKSNQLPIVQNSFHTFSYSVFRKKEEVKLKNYFSAAECDSLFPVRKTVFINNTDTAKKNIVLFIMESVPYDFFDPAGAYKVAMPFFDSLTGKSTFYNNAFCFAHQSNKGITAILAGLPTVSDIPVYHSRFVNMEITRIGAALKKNNYSSFFCIGDEYDNFGFAKCINWLGIEKYYSKEDVPDYKNIPSHSMGLHDEYVLDFFHQKINEAKQPFLAINYNVSTHYPYDLPASYSVTFPENYTAPMKSMRYYDYSLQQFFGAAKNEAWFRHTVFIFCSDHWLVPDDKHVKFNALTGYRIPIIIYEPAVSEGKTDTRMASQFDIMNTILSIARYKDTIISYGNNLLDSNIGDRVIFSRANTNLYHVTDSAYISGYNSTTDKVEFLYHYKTDTALKKNLVTDISAEPVRKTLTIKIKAFLQKANMQYNGAAFK